MPPGPLHGLESWFNSASIFQRSPPDAILAVKICGEMPGLVDSCGQDDKANGDEGSLLAYELDWL
jgi:hypothetical protein